MPRKKPTEPELTIEPVLMEDETVQMTKPVTSKPVRTRKPVDKRAEEIKFLKAQLAEQIENVHQCRVTIDALQQNDAGLRKEVGRLSRDNEIKGTVIANAVSTLANLHQSILLATRTKEG